MNRTRGLLAGLRLLSAALAVACAPAWAAQVVVPPGASVTMASGKLVLACADLYVQGSLLVGTSQVNDVRDVSINATGILDGGQGTIRLGGNWTNVGAFQAGTGTVAFGDTCSGPTSQLSGTSAFYNLDFTSSIGRTLAIPPGKLISVAGAFTLDGLAGPPVQVVSSTPGLAAFVSLLSGAQLFSNNAQLSVDVTVAPSDPAFPDFNADGRPDIIWSNTTSGATYIWRMNGPALISDSFLATIDPSWRIQGVADFNGDGHPDVVWRNTANGNCYVWYLVNGVLQTDAFVFGLPPEWVIQGVADFNADGKPDFLMRNTVSGNAFAWFFNDNVAIGDQFLFNIDPSWKVEGVADLNADGQPDLLFRNMTSGLAFAWNTQFAAGTLSLSTSSPPIFGIDPVWEVVQVADWNADGKPDLLFRNASTGLVFVWYLDGVALGASDYVTQIDPSWEIVPRR